MTDWHDYNKKRKKYFLGDCRNVCMNLVQSTFTTRSSLNGHIFVYVDDRNHRNAVSVICTNAVSASDSFSRFLVLHKFICMHVYLSEYCKLTTGRSHLRSANACLLSVPRTRTTYSDRSFAVSGPLVWNSLPMALRSSYVTEETFRRQLKTFLFNCLDN